MKTLVFGLVGLMSACTGLEAYGANRNSAESAGFQIAIWNPVQLVPEASDVRGLRINYPYGRNQNVSGLDYGIANIVCEDLCGLQVGMINKASDAQGVQIGAWLSMADGMSGLQFSLISMVSSAPMNGVQNSGGNFAKEMNGLQNGLINVATETTGVQIGLVNITTRMTGVQFGLVNIIKDSALPFFPLINAHF
jgi:hypothetical protein